MDFEKNVEELKKVVVFKDTTDIGDTILIMATELILFGVVTKIEKDIYKKGDWWNFTFTLLTIPLQEITWIVRTEQFTGKETFTMNGEFRFIAALDLNVKPEKPKPKLKVVRSRQ